MKVVIEVNSDNNFDYEYFIDWLNDELSNSSFASENGGNVEASISSVDGKKKY